MEKIIKLYDLTVEAKTALQTMIVILNSSDWQFNLKSINIEFIFMTAQLVLRHQRHSKTDSKMVKLIWLKNENEIHCPKPLKLIVEISDSYQ